MEFIVPRGAQVHITIGAAPLLALPNGAAPPAPPAPHPRRLLLKSVAALVLLAGVYELGHLRSGGSSVTSPAMAALAVPPAPPSAPSLAALGEQHAFPDRPLPEGPADARGASGASGSTDTTAPTAKQLPASFARQLRQAPTVTPPPGAAKAGPASANPFGLHE